MGVSKDLEVGTKNVRSSFTVQQFRK